MKMIFCLLFTSNSQPGSAETRAKAILSLAEACHRFTPLVAVREGEAIFLDMTASLHLFQQETFARRLQALSRRFGLAPRVSSADDAPTALALARTSIRNLRDLPLDSLTDFLSPFEPIGNHPPLARQARKLIDLFATLGFGTLDDFLRIPTDMLASRFGKDGVQAGELVRKRRTDAWPVFRLPEIIQERVDLFEADTMAPCSDLEPLLLAAKTLIDRVMSRLRARSLRASAIFLEFEMQKIAGLKAVQPRRWELYLPQPQGSSHGLIPILRDRLAFDLQRDPLISPVVSIELRILETAPGHGAQSSFFSRQLEDAEAWDGLVARLAQKLGNDHVFNVSVVDRHLPEAAWKAEEPKFFGAETKPTPTHGPTIHPTPSPTIPGPTQGNPPGSQSPPTHPPRPIRLLKKPELLLREGEVLIRNTKRQQRWSIVRWEGPERINGEWWDGGFDRDYFRVHTRDGEQLWIYLSPPVLEKDGDGELRASGHPEFYLHGYFD